MVLGILRARPRTIVGLIFPRHESCSPRIESTKCSIRSLCVVLVVVSTICCGLKIQLHLETRNKSTPLYMYVYNKVHILFYVHTLYFPLKRILSFFTLIMQSIWAKEKLISQGNQEFDGFKRLGDAAPLVQVLRAG